MRTIPVPISLRSPWRRRSLLTAALFVAARILLTSCSLDDPRDLCCPDRCAMTYTYRPYGSEAFTEYITSMRHFLFRRDGHLLEELPAGDDLQYQPLDLPEGEYTMVTVANAAEATLLNHDTSPHVTAFTLRHSDNSNPSNNSNNSNNSNSSDNSTFKIKNPKLSQLSDELYWGVRHFAISSDGTATDLGPESRRRSASASTQPPRSTLTTEMNNIHCHLTIRVVWYNVPEHIGPHELELDGVPTRYTLDPDLALDADGFTVPPGDSLSVRRMTVPMIGQELSGEFITLRLSDEHIPTLRIRYGDLRVGPDIDLRKAFASWGWRPSEVHVQKYSLTVTLYGDGRAEVTPGFGATVADWIDGGTFG